MATSAMNDYELQRQLRLEENRRRMEEMGLLQQKSILESFAPRRATANAAPKPPKQTWLVRRPRIPLEPRRSKRILGERIDYCEIGDNDVPIRLEGRGASADGTCSHGCGGGYHELLDLMERGAHQSQAQTQDAAPDASASADGPSSSQPDTSELQEQLQQIRCSSQGRGSVYDSSIGITCHFCRQKKLCGEENCPRCQRRDAGEECIGKTDCSRCHSAFGKFCRACLLIRYGETLEEANEKMKAGTWLCPHCYEEEHPDDGWICNSSICMKRRGLKPTGIAIYDAQQRGFKSVGHLLQAQLQKKGGIKALTAAAAGDGPDAPAEDGKSNDTSGNGTAKDAEVAAVGASGSGEETESDCEVHKERRTGARAGARAGAGAAGPSAQAEGDVPLARRGRGRPPRAPTSKPSDVVAAGVAAGRVTKARGAASGAVKAGGAAAPAAGQSSGGAAAEDVPLAVRRSQRARK